jgi:Domain of unknown function (DUF4145)
MIMLCGHCGNQTVWELHEPYETDKKSSKRTWEVSEYKVYTTLMCSTCFQPTLRKTIMVYLEVDNELVEGETEILYPTKIVQLKNLPETIEKKYQAALRVRFIEPNACAVLVGRTLEAACNHENAEGRNLAQKLNELAQRGRIPDTLAEMAQQLRELRNLGAHDAEDEVTEEDVPIILDFLEAILEYLYVAPAKIEAVRARLTRLPVPDNAGSET